MFVVLALMGLAVGWVVARVPEPRRGGENDLPGPGGRGIDAPTHLAELVEEQGVEPKEDVILEGDVSAMPLRPAIEYVMQVRTVVMIIIASALGDVFFTALQVFGVLFLVDQFGISASTASILIPLVGVGGFVGVLGGGRGGDLLIERGVLTGRDPHRRLELPRGRDHVGAGVRGVVARRGPAVPRGVGCIADRAHRAARGGAASTSCTRSCGAVPRVPA